MTPAPLVKALCATVVRVPGSSVGGEISKRFLAECLGDNNRT